MKTIEDGNNIYLFRDNFLYKLDKNTNDTKIMKTHNNITTLSVTDDFVYYGTADGQLFKLNKDFSQTGFKHLDFSDKIINIKMDIFFTSNF